MILPKLPVAIAIMLMIMDMMEIITVTIHAQPFPLIRPHAIIRLATPRAITIELAAAIARLVCPSRYRGVQLSIHQKYRYL
jgi:hypothetical protein